MDPLTLDEKQQVATIATAAQSAQAGLRAGQAPREAFAQALRAEGVPYAEGVRFVVRHEHEETELPYEADFICYRRIFVQLHEAPEVGEREERALLPVLKASDHRLAVLVALGGQHITHRIVRLPHHHEEGLDCL